MKDAIIETLRERVPRIIDRELPYSLTTGQGRCLPSSRIALETFAYFGIEAKPMVTVAISANREWIEWQEAGGEGEMPDEAWSVAIDPRPETGGGYPGHLVVEIDGNLLDLDARGLARPAHGIRIPETVLLPLYDRAAVLNLDKGGILVYGEHRCPPSWRGAKDWRIAKPWAGEVIRALKERDAVHVS
jgi:hypothetical protein